MQGKKGVEIALIDAVRIIGIKAGKIMGCNYLLNFGQSINNRFLFVQVVNSTEATILISEILNFKIALTVQLLELPNQTD